MGNVKPFCINIAGGIESTSQLSYPPVHIQQSGNKGENNGHPPDDDECRQWNMVSNEHRYDGNNLKAGGSLTQHRWLTIHSPGNEERNNGTKHE